MSAGALDDARARFDAGDFRGALDAAQAGLENRPEDPDLLRIAGRAGVELGAEDAVEQLRRVADLRSGEADSWLDLGDALAAEGRMDEAADAFHRVLELDPTDEAALTAVGHAAYASGSGTDAVSYLEQAAKSSSGASSAMISLVDMYREMGQLDEALAAAVKIADAAPENTAAALDVAELSIQLERWDEALHALERVRGVDELAGHEVYALHGMLQVEMRRGNWERAHELAHEALAADHHGRTGDMLAFLEARVSGEPAGEAPKQEEVEAALSASLEEHHRLHAEDSRVDGEGDLLA